MTTLLNKGWNALAWRFRGLVGDTRLDRIIYKCGMAWRKLLARPVFVAVAGSVGKTTTKDLLVGIFIAKKGKVVGNMQSLNMAPEIAKIILRVRPWTRYCVAELGESSPNTLDSMLTLLQPAIAIVTNVGDDHISAFGSRDAIASELCKAVLAVPDSGTVVLNADDPRVAGMANGLKCRVLKFGLTESADIRARDVVCVWPDPLEFTVEYQAQTLSVKTQLYGRQLLTSALAAIGGGLAAGLTLEECAAGIRTVPPPEGRLQLVRQAGVMFMRDDFKASYSTVEPLFEQVRDAIARRKIIVLGSISDIQRKKERVYHRIANKALEVADIVIFAGRFGSYALKARNPENAHRLHTFMNTRDVYTFINKICEEGDLIVLKGTSNKDHLERIPLAFSHEINCWSDDCNRAMFCSECSHLKRHRGLTINKVEKNKAEKINVPATSLPTASLHEQVIIGLGNPGEEYAQTPHNVGYEVLDYLCGSLNADWEEFSDAWMISGTISGRDGRDHTIRLIKIRSPINLSGPILKKLSDDMAFGPEQCVLVFDDADSLLGDVKVRMNGSSGGHRGVASVLDAFQTDKIRRIKIGVADETATVAKTEMVLRKFSAENLEKIKPALQLAAKRLTELI